MEVVSLTEDVLEIFLIVFLLLRCRNYERKIKELKEEIALRKCMDASYLNLVKEMRIKLHDFHNQLTAILGMHFVYDTYEELVKSQEKYGRELFKDHKYRKLPGIGDNAVAGFLYQKFAEIEAAGIEIALHVHIENLNMSLPVHQFVEILGILLDNAVEAAAENTGKKVIAVMFAEENEGYIFSVRNRHGYVANEELAGWFRLGKSSKGGQRGIGLYRVKVLCDRFKCRIYAENVEAEEENWIRLTIEIPKESSL